VRSVKFIRWLRVQLFVQPHHEPAIAALRQLYAVLSGESWTPLRPLPSRSSFFIFAALFGAVGQFLYKSVAERAGGSIASYLFNARLLGGVVCYVAVMGLFVAAFKRSGALLIVGMYLIAR